MTKILDHKHQLLNGLSMAALMMLATGCSTAQTVNSAAKPAPMTLASSTVEASGDMEAGTLVLGATATDNAVIIAATGMNGLEVFSIDGKSLGSTPAGETVGIDAAYGFGIAGSPQTLIGTIDQSSSALRFFTLSGSRLTEVGAGKEDIDFAAENLCFYRHPLDGALYAFIVGDGGQIDQNLVYADDTGKVSIRQMRRINVPATVKQCAADPATATVYASEELVGIWRFNADPEAETGAVMIDRVGRDSISDEVGGLALYDGGDEARWLLASNLGAGSVNIYDTNSDYSYIGTMEIAGDDGAALEEPGQLHVVSYGLGENGTSGALLVADEDAGKVRIIPTDEIAARFGVSAGTGTDPRSLPKPAVTPVLPTVETAAVDSFGDAADDPVIWANPSNPDASLVIGTDKKAGLYVYNMRGEVVQFLGDGKMNNVDLRGGFSLGGETVTLVTASDRTHKTIAIYALDEVTGLLSDVANGPQPTGLDDPYGLCMYRNPDTGSTYVFINGDETRKRQWELTDAGNGKVDATLVRDLSFDSQTEGCVADDRSGALYVGEEDVGIWKYGADPSTGTIGALIDTVSENEFIHDDVEGMSIYALDSGGGYLIVSSQGDDTYAVYDLETDVYLGKFAVVASPGRGIDGASETDGLDVSSANMGAGFESGGIVVQDGRNIMPNENQNYKYVPWSYIATALGLRSN